MNINRRSLLKNSLISTAALLTLPLNTKAAEQCLAGSKTPAQAKGPFYPVVDQIDTNADLVLVNGADTVAKGKVVIVEGIVTDQN